MKEITLKLVDNIADQISQGAKEMGLTSEELIKYIVGRWIQTENARKYGPLASLLSTIPNSLNDAIRGSMKLQLKAAAVRGELKCKNCTLPLTAEDVDKMVCHSCNAPVDMAGPASGE